MSSTEPATASPPRREAFPGWLPLWLIVAIGTLARIPQVFHAVADDNPFRQAQTALVAREYADHGINLLHTPLPVFGPGSDVPMEFPLVQGLAALIVNLGVPADMATRLVGLAGFQVSAALLFLLVSRWHGRTCALIALCLFQFLPYGLAYGASALIEFPAVAFALAMVWFLDLWFDSGGLWRLLLGVACAWAAFLIKVTTAPAWSILVVASSVTALLAHRGRRTLGRVLVGNAGGPGLGLAAAFAWAHYADSIKENQPLTQFLTSDALADWNLSLSWDTRLDPSMYMRLLERYNSEVAGPLVLAGMAVAVLTSQTMVDRVRAFAWIGVALSAPLVFINLYVIKEHGYYRCAVYAAWVVLAALALTALVNRLQRRMPARLAIAATVIAAVAVSGLWPAGERDLRQWLAETPPPSWAASIKDATNETDQLIVIGCDWSPILAFYGERTLLMFRGANAGDYWLAPQEDQAGNYSHLFTCRNDLTPNRYLPAGYSTAPTSTPNLFQVVATP